MCWCRASAKSSAQRVPIILLAVVKEPFLLSGGDVGRDISVFRDLLANGDLDEKGARSVQFLRAQQKKVSE
jgi:hypothetical protein